VDTGVVHAGNGNCIFWVLFWRYWTRYSGSTLFSRYLQKHLMMLRAVGAKMADTIIRLEHDAFAPLVLFTVAIHFGS
jgi:hypothetical protein